jgi:OmpA-OmpF porin, OOP family
VKVKMRLRAVLFAGAALGLTGVAIWHAAQVSTDYLEARDRTRVAELLSNAGEAWTGVEADGLEIQLSGQAPDEASRFRAVEIARRAIDPDRIIDETDVASPAPRVPPPFALELLRNDAEISLIGLVPAGEAQDRDASGAIREKLAGRNLALGVTDMLETADYPEPEGWAESLDFALEVLATLPRAKISVEPGRVRVIAVTDSADAKAFLERRLTSEKPDGIALMIDISAPRPVITPFRLTFTHDGARGRLETCSAEDDAAVAMIVAAAREAGLDQAPRCDVGLGSPSPDWPDAAAAGIAAVGELEGGSFQISDTTARLTGAQGMAPDAFDQVSKVLATALPDTYSLETVPPPPPVTADEQKQDESVTFVAALAEDGRIRLEGAVRDETSRQAIQSYASALFGHDMVSDETVVDETVPDGWPGRVIAGIDALHEIKEGRFAVTPTGINLIGWGTSEKAQERIVAMLTDRGELATVRVRFDAKAAAAEAHARELASMSRPEICASEIGAILEAQSIQFKPGSAQISPESRGVIAAIADVLRSCPGAQLEVAGHTDSQGQEDSNTALSTERAEAVRVALEAQDLPLILFRARGYGAEFPIADNETEAGRRLNRRIELTLFEDAPRPSQVASSVHTLAPSECANRVSDLLGEDAIEFDVGASAISPGSQHVIATLAQTLQRCEGSSFEISGYTDSLGQADVNLRISSERAKAVRDALEAEGLPETVTLSSRGYGADDPIADNSTSEGRALNRRIEMHLLSDAGAERSSGAVATPLERDPDSGEYAGTPETVRPSGGPQ